MVQTGSLDNRHVYSALHRGSRLYNRRNHSQKLLKRSTISFQHHFELKNNVSSKMRNYLFLSFQVAKSSDTTLA